LVDSAGHLPGRINGLVRLGRNKFIYLASDLCHFTSLLRVECEIAVGKNDKGELTSVHSVKEKAERLSKRFSS